MKEETLELVKEKLKSLDRLLTFDPAIKVHMVTSYNDAKEVHSIYNGENIYVTHEYGVSMLENCTANTLEEIFIRLNKLTKSKPAK